MKVLVKDSVFSGRVELHFDKPVGDDVKDKLKEMDGVAHAFIDNRYCISLSVGLLFSKEDVMAEAVALLGAVLVYNEKQ